MFKYIFAALICLLPSLGFAQEKSRAILVLDASGSMWGQIDGKAKITIAQEVIGELLQSLPADQELGLTVYGHRRKGDCSDIETLILPGGDTRNAIMMAVNAITPKGKTPLSAAVIQAAESLKYTEERATVILISDGRETCELDPCQVGRDLEKAGIDFTAHVIGFDISDAKDRAELQCLADETGGTFRTASNASELTDALQVIAEPEPTPFEIGFRATAGENGPVILDLLVWELFDKDGKSLATTSSKAKLMTVDLLPGDYSIDVLRPEDEAIAKTGFTVADSNMTVTLVLPVLTPPASLSAPDTAIGGSNIDIEWDGPNAKNDIITVSEIGSPGQQYIATSYTRDGSPVSLKMPLKAGEYQLRYVLGQGREIIARRKIIITPVTATLNPPMPITAGSTFSLEWDGPNYKNDYISMAKPGTAVNQYVTYERTRDGSPMQLRAPTTPGTYILRYIAAGPDRMALATKEVEVVAVSATLEFTSPAPAGGKLTVTWDGPGGEDYIAIAQPGMKVNDEVTYAYVKNSDGNAVEIDIPTTPSTYELRYIQKGNEKKILAVAELVVEPVMATLEFTSPAPAGGKLEVTWGGPGGDDYIAIAQAGMKVNEEVTYAYVKNSDGNAVEIDIPTTPGTYELRYIQKGNEKKMLAIVELVVEPVKATLEFTSPAPAGGKLPVTWSGPGGPDYLSIAQPSMKVNEEVTYAYVTNSDGNTVEIDIPTTPGTYELRYIQKGNERKMLAAVELVVEPVKATLEFASPAPAGGKLTVTWDGPGGDDYIAIAQAGMKVNEEVTYAYLNNGEGNTVEINIPAAPGVYEMRYIQKGNERKILTVIELDVVPMTASLKAAEIAKAGEKFKVTWTGPSHRRDTIIIAKPGSDSAEAFASVAAGSPATLYAPMVKGDYEIHYIYGPLNKVLGVIPLKVE